MKPSILQEMSKEDRNDFYIAIAIILAALIFILNYSFSSKEDSIPLSNSIITENPMQIDSIVVGDDTYTPIAKIDRRSAILKPQKLKRTVPKETLNSSRAPQSRVASLDTILGTDTTIISIPTEIKTDLAIIDTIEAQTDTTAKDISTAAVEEEVPTTKNQATIPSKTVINDSDSRQCIIIVGAFGKKSNITNIVSRLKADGYNSFTTPYKGLTRVGLYQTCEVKELQSTLKTVRKKYAPDATVLTKK